MRSAYFRPTLTCLIAAVAMGSITAAPPADEIPPLHDPPTTARLPGKFIWADLFTTDAPAAAGFYAALFGWKATTVTRGSHTYTLLWNEDRTVAGIVPRSRLLERPQQRARWIGYLAVADVDRALSDATSAGGEVLAPAREFTRRGVQAIIADHEGSAVGVMYSKSGDTPDYQAEPGDWIWAELFVRQPEKAAAFYRQVFRHEITPDGTTTNRDHFVLTSAGFARAGIASLPEQEDAQPGWLGFVRVGRVNETAARVPALGGRVLVAPRTSPTGGRFAVVADPTGAAIGVIEINSDSAPARSP